MEKLKRRWRRKPLLLSDTEPEADGPLWSRLALAERWRCSDRKVDRMRKAGLLGEPVARIGRTVLYSDQQVRAAERAGLTQTER
jgi:hypothetical protein